MTAAWKARPRRAAAMVLASLAALAVGSGPAALAGTAPVAAGDISTVIGGVGGPGVATTVSMEGPCGVAADGSNLLVGDEGTVRRVATGTDQLTTLAGTNEAGTLTTKAPATLSNLHNVCGVAADHHGNVLFTGSTDQVLVVAHSNGWFYQRKMTAGDLYVVAGKGGNGDKGNGGPATQAKLDQPRGVTVDAAGNVIIDDSGNNQIRVVAEHTGTYYGQAMTAGHIYPIAGTGTRGFSGDGGPATAAELAIPGDVTLDHAGNLVIADTGNFRIRVVAENTGTYYNQAMTAGDIYTIGGDGTDGYAGDGGPATAAEISPATGVTVDAAGDVLLADTGNYRVRMIAEQAGTVYGQTVTPGNIYPVAGNGYSAFDGVNMPALAAAIASPSDVTTDAAGNLVISIGPGEPYVLVVAASTGRFYDQNMTAGYIYALAGNGYSSRSGGGELAARAQISQPWGVTADPAGDVFASDFGNNRVVAEAAAGGTLFGEKVVAGHMYLVAGSFRGGYSGDGGAARSAEVNGPAGLAVDASGNLLIADSQNNRIRVVAGRTGTFYGQAMTAGHIYTVAGTGGVTYKGNGGPATSATLSQPQDVAVDASGNLVIADTYHYRIRVVAEQTGMFYGQAMTAGHIYSVAGDGKVGYSGDGGPATAATLLSPGGVTTDRAGNLVIADTDNNRIRVVAEHTGTFYGQAMTAGDIYTVAGTGGYGFSGDGGPATSATFALPQDVTVDSAGNLVISDTANSRIRVVAEQTGMFYGQAMTAGDVYTIAGDGQISYSGNGGPATSATLRQQQGVAVDGAGDVLIADTGDNLVRRVSAG